MIEYKIEYKDKEFDKIDKFEEFISEKTRMGVFFDPLIESAVLFTGRGFVQVPIASENNVETENGNIKIDVQVEDDTSDLIIRAGARSALISMNKNERQRNIEDAEETINKRINLNKWE